ncbi:MAG: hypothetical protein M3N93_06685 [Acidobacteriota bacterium]|nr:hypothetical protein [Acidobacteriota bacterium]
MIFYRVREPGIEIMHIVHGRRDLTRYTFLPTPPSKRKF